MVGHFTSHVTYLQTIYKYIKERQDKVVMMSKLCLIVDYDEGWRISLDFNRETVYTVND